MTKNRLSRKLSSINRDRLCDTFAQKLDSFFSAFLRAQPRLGPSEPHSLVLVSSAECDISSANSMANAVSTAIVGAFDVLAPKREIVSTRRKPWVSQEARELMKQRDRAFKRASASGTVEDFTRYKGLRSEVSNLLDTAKNRHLSAKLADAPDARAK